MTSILILTEQSKIRLQNILDGVYIKGILSFRKIAVVDTLLNFLPEVIEDLITDYLTNTYTCDLERIIFCETDDTKRLLFTVIDTNIYFEIYIHDGKTVGVHASNFRNRQLQNVVSYTQQEDVFIIPSLNNYMKKYYGIDNYFVVNTFNRDTMSVIEKVHDHKSLRLMIVMLKVLFRVIKKKIPDIMSKN